MNKFVVVDLETTGNNNRGQDRIIQIAAFVLENGEVIEQFSTFINPNVEIPAFITELTGISREMVQYAPQFEQIADELYPIFENAYFVAHNVHFDLTFLQKEFERVGLPKIYPLSIDTVELTRILFPTLSSYKLSDLAKIFNIQHENPHQADSDAEVTAELLTILLNKLESLPYATLKILESIGQNFKSDITYYIADLIQKKSNEQNKENQNIEEFRRIAIRKNLFNLPQEEEDFVDFQEHLTNDLVDRMAVEIPNFIKREEQFSFMEDVFNAFQSNNIFLAEASTGVGKTYGYLIPAAFFSKQNGKQVIISTSTISLQRQITNKHMKTIEKILPFQIKIASIQSKKNYLCLHKFEYVIGELDDNYDSILSKAMISVWLTETESGELDELSLPSGGIHLWERVCCSDESENKRSNPWFTKCFYQKAKNQLLLADLIVTNHAYLLSTLKNKDHLLNSVKTIVIDEAHALEETASKTFGVTFSCLKYYQYLSRLSTTEGNELVNRLYKLDEELGNSREKWWKKIDHLIKEIKYESDDLFRLLRDFTLSKQTEYDKENIRQSISLTEKNKASQNWKVILECANRLMHTNNALFSECNQYIKLTEGIKTKSYYKAIISEFKLIINQLFIMKNGLQEILFDQNDQYICWMDTEAKGSFHTTMLFSEKINNADFVQQFVLKDRDSILLTSATMSIDNTFDFIKSGLGLIGENVIEKIYPVPNDFQQGMKVYIPNDLKGIKDISQEEYAVQTSNAIKKIVNTVGGRTLVLFTAFDLLKQTYDNLLNSSTINSSVLAQGFSPGGKQRLIKQFLQSKQTILLGTNTFWEGIDLPNEELDCLIIVRLPFTNPDKPMFIAKSNVLKNAGENSFTSLALPLAVFKFRQGYGRLIRNEFDKGALFVLDNRIINAKYGKEFLKLIPKNKIKVNTMNELLNEF